MLRPAPKQCWNTNQQTVVPAIVPLLFTTSERSNRVMASNPRRSTMALNGSARGHARITRATRSGSLLPKMSTNADLISKSQTSYRTLQTQSTNCHHASATETSQERQRLLHQLGTNRLELQHTIRDSLEPWSNLTQIFWQFYARTRSPSDLA